jgi:hypothetical protein
MIKELEARLKPIKGVLEEIAEKHDIKEIEAKLAPVDYGSGQEEEEEEKEGEFLSVKTEKEEEENKGEKFDLDDDLVSVAFN